LVWAAEGREQRKRRGSVFGGGVNEGSVNVSDVERDPNGAVRFRIHKNNNNVVQGLVLLHNAAGAATQEETHWRQFCLLLSPAGILRIIII